MSESLWPFRQSFWEFPADKGGDSPWCLQDGLCRRAVLGCLDGLLLHGGQYVPDTPFHFG